MEKPSDVGNPDSPLAALTALPDQTRRLKAELRKAIVGQESTLDDVILALYCGEHALLTGVPGLAKTLMIRTLGRALALDFHRIQFTPDLMPADITGSEVLQEDAATGRRIREFLPGPVFTHLLLADEINRTPPRTQAAMLQTMQEREVTTGNETRPLPRPFHVFATRNPIEQEGTYPLPEAALDRFMLAIEVHYPSPEEEISIVDETVGGTHQTIEPVLTGTALQEIQRSVRSVPAARTVIAFAVRLVTATRPGSDLAPAGVRDFVRWGASPRASQYLVLGAKARAAIAGRSHATFSDVRSVARQVLEHRILCNFKARSAGRTEASIVEEILDGIRDD